MILAVGNVKGGVGKTTLAVNLAIALSRKGRDVLLVDGDEQATAISFTDLRTERQGAPGYTAVALKGIAIRTQVRQLAGKYSDIVLDVGGRDTGSLRAALTVADVILIPVQPRSFDLWGADQTADLVREAREINEHLRAIAVLNAAILSAMTTTMHWPRSRRWPVWKLPTAASCAARLFPTPPPWGFRYRNTTTPRPSKNLTRVTQNLFHSDIGAKLK